MVQLSESSVLSKTSAVRKSAKSSLGIEVRDSLSTDRSSPHILMHIHEGVDASLTKLVDEGLNLVKVLVVIDTGLLLYSFPHHS